jgi:hypothetical protein
VERRYYLAQFSVVAVATRLQAPLRNNPRLPAKGRRMEFTSMKIPLARVVATAMRCCINQHFRSP